MLRRDTHTQTRAYTLTRACDWCERSGSGAERSGSGAERSGSGRNFRSPLRSRSATFPLPLYRIFHAPLPLHRIFFMPRSRSFNFRTRSGYTPHKGASWGDPLMAPKHLGLQCSRKIYVKDKTDYFLHHLRLMYPKMSQVKGRNQKKSAGFARSIVFISPLSKLWRRPDYDG